ncbi:uncharacterized protein LOC128550371 [Mercenaria mercenaria]|uniref:uncharacterized protein LOC128550371 n=1 Tax=Mercenaria mercenaria TaxID=6596 RepID=UPI00234E564E|nr:uncharacterized protein LOC128550371 [Mercenaria mercenaria]
MEVRFSVGGMDNASFWNISLFAGLTGDKSFTNDLCRNISSFLKSQRTYYEMLNGLANYLEHVPQILFDKINMDLLKELQSFQRDIYSCMCQIKIVLRVYNQDPVEKVPGGNLSSIFIQLLHGTREDQITSEYVVLLDSQKILKALLSFYSQFRNSPQLCHTPDNVLIG